jgi:hypothetical protein
MMAWNTERRSNMTNPNEDHYGWTQETIEKLHQGRWEEVEIDYLLEELEERGQAIGVSLETA